ncbi:amidohydrolase [Rhodobacterales bacterium HKCCE2091]|nr:amidohydrolase [Rhodobacterales bacterium HKCCE2091]
MPVLNRIAGLAPEMQGWRRHLHAHPELGYDCVETADYVAARLREFGVDEVHKGIARTGIVAVIRGQGKGPAVGLRADMDALPITEETGLPHASTRPGVMHACGHDGHTAMLLGAAKYLAETRNFAGDAVLIFQPAEESGAGAEAMVAEGIMDRFGVGQVYAIHNAPGVPEGRMLTAPGPLMAAVDTFHVHVEGKGGHGAMPHETRDPIPAAAAMVQAVQTIVSRNRHAAEDLVISVTQIHAGTTDNVIPSRAYLCGTVRTFEPRVQDMVEDRMTGIVAGIASAHGVCARLDYERGYPATVNTAPEARFAARVAAEIVGETRVEADAAREMGAEDFAYMLRERPGAYLFLGQGDGAGLHHPEYEFNDAVAPVGASFFARLVERALPLDGAD